MATVRRPKWHPPPPQTPRILHLPRPATRRRQGSRSAGGRSVSSFDQGSHRRTPTAKLETLFGQERTFRYTIPPEFLLNSSKERSRVEDRLEDDGRVEVGIWEEKWRFQAEILRAECKFLRMEREISAKRLERERVSMERTLKSAVHALISAKRKIGEGQNVTSVLEDEIEELMKKFAELQKSSKKATRRDPQLLKGDKVGSSNFDKGATLLQKQLERIGGLPTEKCSKDLREIAKASLFKFGTEEGSTNKECDPIEACNKLADVEVLRRKMEGLSKGKLLKKMEEEYGLMVSRTYNSSATNSASTSKLSSSLQEPLQEEGKLAEQNICAGHCKALVRRIMEQVRAETEQWSQMQELLGQVREEMEELQASRDFWEDQALDSDFKVKSLKKTVQEWQQKAASFEAKEKQLEDLATMMQEELERVRKEKAAPAQAKKSKDSSHLSRGAAQSQEKENKVLTCRVKGKDSCMKRDTLNDGKQATRKGGSKFTSPSRLPFMDIGNLSPLVRQNSRRSVFPLQSPPH